jgi:hypothetical protein
MTASARFVVSLTLRIPWSVKFISAMYVAMFDLLVTNGTADI